MADLLITRRGGKSADRTAAPSINFISATTTSLTFTFKNNENTSVDLYYGLTTPPTTKITLAANATSSNITFSALNNTDTFNIYSYAIDTNTISKKIKSEIVSMAASTLVPAPTIIQVSKTAFAITFTVRNNARLAGDVIFGITNPPTTTVTLNANTTSSNQTISNLDPVTTYTVFAQTQVPGFSDSAIVSSNVTTDSDIIYTVATGGTISTIGNHRYHVFTSNGTFSVSQVGTDNTVNALVVAGGGGGGDRHGGGGGAGGVFFIQEQQILQHNYTVNVGAAGAGGNYETANSSARGSGLRGSNSLFGNVITALGGGGGTTYDGASNQNSQGVGSGGGGAGGNGTARAAGIAGTSGQGNSGGNGIASGGFGGGGGGGAGGAGGNSGSTLGGNGGIGRNLSTIFPNWGTNASNTTSGTRGYFGGGGGGCTNVNTSSTTPGGAGGGGRGSWDAQGSAALANTGGGGGGSRSQTEPSRGFDGGSGIVIVRYQISA